MTARAAVRALVIRNLAAGDIGGVERIDAQHTGRGKRAYWARVFRLFVGRRTSEGRIALGAFAGPEMAGYLLGEVRAFEFGSEPCGWVFAVGVDRKVLRGGVATSLLEEACRLFQAAGVSRVRTMVRRTEVPVHSFFRANGFVAGSFVQLERELGDRS